jgi:hypothetical protein
MMDAGLMENNRGLRPLGPDGRPLPRRARKRRIALSGDFHPPHHGNKAMDREEGNTLDVVVEGLRRDAKRRRKVKASLEAPSCEGMKPIARAIAPVQASIPPVDAHPDAITPPSAHANPDQATDSRSPHQRGIILFDLERTQCHWPFEGLLYCGEPCGERVYCPDHLAMMYRR